MLVNNMAVVPLRPFRFKDFSGCSASLRLCGDECPLIASHGWHEE
ncbi:MAG TPA: hypothetical protein VLW45_11820 [Pelomicrobium sp.]|nr:hypothetical protein [Pelomicrobium sp.]